MISTRIAALLAITLLLARGVTQCTPQWLPDDPGVNGQISAMTWWDPDGPGPAHAVIAVAGSFTAVGTQPANSIATYDITTGAWSTLGSGTNGRVVALAALPNGDLIAGGGFTMAGGVGANCIARWDGTSWSPLGAGLPITVTAVTRMPNGDVVAATNGSLGILPGVQRWDGSAWTTLGSYSNQGYLGASALAVAPNGNLIVGGWFFSINGVAALNIAQWNGAVWSPLGNGLDDSVRALTILGNGDVVAAGLFAASGSVAAYRVARWNGNAWSPVGAGFPNGGMPNALATLANGDLIAGGVFSWVAGTSANNIARWNGTAWTAMGSGITSRSGNVAAVLALAPLPNGEVVAGGQFEFAGGQAANRLARWSGGSWSSQSSGLNAPVRAMAALANGDFVVGGEFTRAGGVGANRIARWDGTRWWPLGTGTDGVVNALAVLPNGELVAAGNFLTAGGVAAYHVARWNGTAWSPIGTGLFGTVHALAVMPNGDLVAGGYSLLNGPFYAMDVARWDGSAWTVLGLDSPRGEVDALAVLPNGDLVAAGAFSWIGNTSANNIAQWNGTAWSALGSGLTGGGSGGAKALTLLPSGDLVVCGEFQMAGGLPARHIARWGGATWSSIGTGAAPGLASVATAVAALPNGDIVAGGENSLERWNGSIWTPLVPSFSRFLPVLSLHWRPQGELVLGGDFGFVSGVPSASLARYAATCPASVMAVGAGCVGSGGLNTYAAQNLPWIGSTYRARGTNLATTGIVLVASGIATANAPLASVLPLAQPNCRVLVNPFLVQLAANNGGVVETQIVVPNTLWLRGAIVHEQLACLELDPQQQLQATTSSNALTLTVGAF